MTDKKMEINKISRMLINLSKKAKIIAVFISVYFVFLVLYDLFVFDRPLEDIISTYLFLVLVGIFVWFGVRFVYWIQIKNRYCHEKFLNIFVLLGMFVFGVSSILIGVQYFIDGFLISAFIAPIAFLSIVKVQSLRK